MASQDRPTLNGNADVIAGVENDFRGDSLGIGPVPDPNDRQPDDKGASPLPRSTAGLEPGLSTTKSAGTEASGSEADESEADASETATSEAAESATDESVADESEDLYLKRQTVRAMLSHVIDPEVGLDILTMGLIYDVDVSEPGVIQVEMTLTTKGCPMSAYITAAARQVLRQVYPDDDIRLHLVWEPPWTPAMINRDGLDLLRR